VERKAQKGEIVVEFTSIPTKICPKGCSGSYWYWRDFGVEVFEALEPISPNIAAKKGFFKSRQLCKKCETELVTSGISQFHFIHRLQKGTDLKMQISAPSLKCSQCHSSFLPAQTSSHDQFYIDLGDVISEALTSDLIYK